MIIKKIILLKKHIDDKSFFRLDSSVHSPLGALSQSWRAIAGICLKAAGPKTPGVFAASRSGKAFCTDFSAGPILCGMQFF